MLRTDTQAVHGHLNAWYAPANEENTELLDARPAALRLSGGKIENHGFPALFSVACFAFAM